MGMILIKFDENILSVLINFRFMTAGFVEKSRE